MLQGKKAVIIYGNGAFLVTTEENSHKYNEEFYTVCAEPIEAYHIKLPDSNESEIQLLLDKHVEKESVSSIYENIFEHLSNSLKSLGVNPIKTLYNHSSEGLDSLTEDVAIEIAREIQMLLDFVIVKINEERSSIKDVKDALKG